MILFLSGPLAGLKPQTDCKPYYLQLSSFANSEDEMNDEFARMVTEMTEMGTFPSWQNEAVLVDNLALKPLSEVLGVDSISSRKELLEVLRNLVSDHLAGSSAKDFDSMFEKVKEVFKRFLIGKCPKSERKALDKTERLLIKGFISSQPQETQEGLLNSYRQAKAIFKQWLSSYAQRLNTFDCNCRESRAVPALVARARQILLRVSAKPTEFDEQKLLRVEARMTALAAAIRRGRPESFVKTLEALFENAMMFRQGEEFVLANRFFRRALRAFASEAVEGLEMKDSSISSLISDSLLRVIYGRLALVVSPLPPFHELLVATYSETNGCPVNFSSEASTPKSKLLLLELAISQAARLGVFEEAGNVDFSTSSALTLPSSQLIPFVHQLDEALDFSPSMLASFASSAYLLSSIDLLTKSNVEAPAGSKQVQLVKRVLSTLLTLLNEFITTETPGETDHKGFVEAFDKFIDKKLVGTLAEVYPFIKIWSLATYYNDHKGEYTFSWNLPTESESIRKEYNWVLDHIIDKLNSQPKGERLHSGLLFDIIKLSSEDVNGSLDPVDNTIVESEPMEVNLVVEVNIDANAENGINRPVYEFIVDNCEIKEKILKAKTETQDEQIFYVLTKEGQKRNLSLEEFKEEIKKCEDQIPNYPAHRHIIVDCSPRTELSSQTEVPDNGYLHHQYFNREGEQETPLDQTDFSEALRKCELETNKPTPDTPELSKEDEIDIIVHRIEDCRETVSTRKGNSEEPKEQYIVITNGVRFEGFEDYQKEKEICDESYSSPELEKSTSNIEKDSTFNNRQQIVEYPKEFAKIDQVDFEIEKIIIDTPNDDIEYLIAQPEDNTYFVNKREIIPKIIADSGEPIVDIVPEGDTDIETDIESSKAPIDSNQNGSKVISDPISLAEDFNKFTLVNCLQKEEPHAKTDAYFIVDEDGNEIEISKEDYDLQVEDCEKQKERNQPDNLEDSINRLDLDESDPELSKIRTSIKDPKSIHPEENGRDSLSKTKNGLQDDEKDLSNNDIDEDNRSVVEPKLPGIANDDIENEAKLPVIINNDDGEDHSTADRPIDTDPEPTLRNGDIDEELDKSFEKPIPLRYITDEDYLHKFIDEEEFESLEDGEDHEDPIRKVLIEDCEQTSFEPNDGISTTVKYYIVVDTFDKEVTKSEFDEEVQRCEKLVGVEERVSTDDEPVKPVDKNRINVFEAEETIKSNGDHSVISDTPILANPKSLVITEILKEPIDESKDKGNRNQDKNIDKDDGDEDTDGAGQTKMIIKYIIESCSVEPKAVDVEVELDGPEILFEVWSETGPKTITKEEFDSEIKKCVEKRLIERNIIEILQGTPDEDVIERLSESPDIISYIKEHQRVFDPETGTLTEFAFAQVTEEDSDCAGQLDTKFKV